MLSGLERKTSRPSTRERHEECLQAAKNEGGMGHYQVRPYEPWYRYVTLAMLALAFLTATRAALAKPLPATTTPRSQSAAGILEREWDIIS
jgi:SRSO17 transposase